MKVFTGTEGGVSSTRDESCASCHLNHPIRQAKPNATSAASIGPMT
jgi:hypothetical protein